MKTQQQGAGYGLRTTTNGEKVPACLALVPDFIDNAFRLYQTMSGATWE